MFTENKMRHIGLFSFVPHFEDIFFCYSTETI